MEWYGPLTILPAIGLVILSTANFLVSLNDEIYRLEKDKENKVIIMQKLKQLKRLGRANALLYLSAVLFLFSALEKVLLQSNMLFRLLMILGTILMALALVILFIHSLKAITIRHKNLKL